MKKMNKIEQHIKTIIDEAEAQNTIEGKEIMREDFHKVMIQVANLNNKYFWHKNKTLNHDLIEANELIREVMDEYGFEKKVKK